MDTDTVIYDADAVEARNALRIQKIKEYYYKRFNTKKTVSRLRTAYPLPLYPGGECPTGKQYMTRNPYSRHNQWVLRQLDLALNHEYARQAAERERRQALLETPDAFERKRPATEDQGPEAKRRRITENLTDEAVVTQVETQPKAGTEDQAQAPTESAVASDNNTARRNSDAPANPAADLLRAAHQAVQQCVRSGVQMATTLRHHFAACQEPRDTHVNDSKDDGFSASAQLQAELAEHISHLSSLSAVIPSLDEQCAIQLQAELINYVSSPSAAAQAPIPSLDAANSVCEDQSTTQQAAMTAENAERPAEGVPQEQAIRETEPSADANEETDAQETRAAVSTSEGHPTINQVSDSEEIHFWIPPPILTYRRRSNQFGQRPAFEGPTVRVVRGRTRSAYIYPDADVDEAEVARQLEAEERGEPYPAAQSEGTVPGQVENAAPSAAHIDQQPVAEPVAQPVTEVAEAPVTPQQPAVAREVVADSWVYRPGIPPLLPWIRRRFLQRRAATDAAIPATPAAPAVAATPGVPAVPPVPAIPPIPAVTPIPAARTIPPTPAVRAGPAPVLVFPPPPLLATPAPHSVGLEAQVEETANLLAGTSVFGDGQVPPDGDPTGRTVSWWRTDTPLGRPVSACQIFNVTSPPINTNNRTAPLAQAAWQAIEAENRRRDERERREELERLIEEKRELLGRVRVPAGEAAVRPLSNEWEAHVRTAMTGPAQRTLVESLEGAKLTKQKLETCYTNLAWLNDEVINGHLALTVDYLRRMADNRGPVPPKYHAFNSFFYSKLRESGYEGVKRWTRRAKIGGEALLNVETLFIPVHQDSHWTLLVLSPKNRTIEYFDSLWTTSHPFVSNVKKWLKGELGDLYDEDEWVVLRSQSPRQNNGSDCGVFLLTTAKAIALGLEPTVYGPADMPLIRRKIVAELLNGGLQGDFEPAGESGEKRL